MLKTRDVYPPKGWRFTESKTGWKLPPGHHFKSAVSQIIEHRRQNPRFNLPTDKETVGNELDAFTCALLKNDPAWCSVGAPVSFQRPPSERRQPVEANASVAVVSDFLRNANVGIKTWVDFFGEGKPVVKAMAEKRAGVCLSGDEGKMCPFHVKGSLLQRLGAAAGKEVLGLFKALHDLDMHTSRDKELEVCGRCDCPMRAKVWVPLPIIRKYISPEVIETLPSFCWIINEGQ
jgi:hypothetical protein